MTHPDTLQEEVLSKSQQWLRSKYSIFGLGLISFVESALPVPLVTDPFLVIYILANRSKAILAVFVATLTSVVGGVMAYGVAYWFSQLFISILSPASLTQFYSLAERVSEETFILTILGALTPVPYTLVALAVGFVKGNLWAFILASITARVLRYGVVGYLTYAFGPLVLSRYKKHSVVLMGVIFITTVLYFILKYYFEVL